MISIKVSASMAQFVVRNLEESVKARLQRRAKRHGRSMEAEVREILRNAANERESTERGLGSEIAALINGTGLHFDAPEFRGNPVRFPTFEDEQEEKK
jgi:antitoxin FitA